MSADNGIYIAKFPEGYRVAHAQAIDNINYYPEGTEGRKKDLKSYFEESEIYENKNSAFEKATILQKEIEDEGGMVEYGICFIGEYESFL